MEKNIALANFRRWKREGMVSVDGQIYSHQTARPSSRELFLDAVAAVRGSIIATETQEQSGHGIKKSITVAHLPVDIATSLQQVKKRPGRLRKTYEEKRQQFNLRVRGRTFRLASSLARKHGLSNWWHALDEAIRRWAEAEGIE